MNVPQSANAKAACTAGSRRRRSSLIGLGGAIGTGLFMGSGIAIGSASPPSFSATPWRWCVALVMVFSLFRDGGGPSDGRFLWYLRRDLFEPLGRVLSCATPTGSPRSLRSREAVAAGLYMTFWFPGVPVWLWSLGFCVDPAVFNSRSVNNFGTVEFWFAIIKVTAIVLFIILGAASIFGLGLPATGFQQPDGSAGRLPAERFKWMWMAVIVGIFSFNGIEVIAVTSGEAQNPEVAIPAALRTMLVSGCLPSTYWR